MTTLPVPRPQRERADRESGLRASILESALELGVGSSRTVANWIFNAVPEEGEEADEEDTISPSLTYASTGTSDASSLSSFPSSNLHPGAGASNLSRLGSRTEEDFSIVGMDAERSGSSSVDRSQRAIQFAVNAPSEQRTSSPAPSPAPGFFRSNKLRKPRSNGYQSDGGHVGDGGKGKKEKDKKSKKKAKESGNATEHESDGGYLSEVSKKSKKGKKDKAADVQSPATDYDTDGGGMSSSARPRKTSVMLPTAGDESDGGNLSEVSTKKKGFFRLNSRSSRKRKDSTAGGSPQREVIPPVPMLPPVSFPLPIADKFIRAGTPSLDDGSNNSRTVTPIPSISVDADRPSQDVATPPELTERIERASIMTHDGLTKAFRDAESVRSPSIDVLSTFRSLARPKAGSLDSVHPYARMYQGTLSPQPPDSPMVVSPPTTSTSRPKISAPNTSTLAPKHVPVPLVLTPATPGHSQHLMPSPDPDYILITPPVTPTGTRRPSSPRSASAVPVTPSSEFLVPTPTTQSTQGVPPSPTGRSHVLGYYDLPPPTPPPQGPLPAVPPEAPSVSGSAAEPRRPILRNVSSLNRLNISARPPGPPPLRELPTPPDSTGGGYVSRAPSAFRTAPADTPPVAQSPTPNQRGRQSPFPVQPVLPRAESSDLVRRTSTRVLKAAASASALQSRAHTPVSADERGESWYGRPSMHQNKDQLRVHWQPRSASALDQRMSDFDFDDGPGAQERQSWVGDLVPHSPRSSFEDDLEPEDDRSVYTSEEHFPPQEREQDALLAEEEGGDGRSSMWSDANSRVSFMDGEMSAKVHERLLKQVEQMYGKAEPIPPVPRLDYPGKNGYF
ncbi:hypothetical protein OBBRIDRAFT_835421 [Obba rivulosa]|uniref:Uncharacterized protein n=1 Tax=Obba rivulosa TaxID=1052685 RepID=A0A8E2B2B8_9APHY|nr:hypothetical protein OBBRIDRAFT_835421 [Obba rivulosa]